MRSHKETRVFLNYSGTGRVQKSFTLSERLVARPQRLTLIFTGVGVLEGHSWNGSCGLQFSLIHSIRSFPSALRRSFDLFSVILRLLGLRVFSLSFRLPFLSVSSFFPIRTRQLKIPFIRTVVSFFCFLHNRIAL